MPNLHSSSLFHFTSREGLLGILSSDFYPKYCKERTVYEEGHWDYWTPLVSFCDIPLSMVGAHILEYGNYGLGMSREWTLQRGLNPVTYYHGRSACFEAFNEMMTHIHNDVEGARQNKVQIVSIETARLNSRYLFQYYKPYRGHDFKIEAEKWFYDEREWRYVPKTIEKHDLLRDDRIDFTAELRATLNQSLQPYALKFTSNDISHVIIKSESERFEFIESLSRIKKVFPYQDVEVLKSKIISVEQIASDL